MSGSGLAGKERAQEGWLRRQRAHYRRLRQWSEWAHCEVDLSLVLWLDACPRLFGMLSMLFQMLMVPFGLLLLSQLCLQFPAFGHYAGMALFMALIVGLWWLAPRILLSAWRLLLASLSAVLLLFLLDYGVARLFEPQRVMAASEPYECYMVRPYRGAGEPRRVCDIRIRIDGHSHLLEATGTGYWMRPAVPVALYRGLLGVDYPRLILEDAQ